MNNQMDNRPDRNRPNRNNPGNQGPNKNRQSILAFLICLLISLVCLSFVTDMMSDKSSEITYDKFIEMVEKDQVKEVTLQSGVLTVVPKIQKSYYQNVSYKVNQMEDADALTKRLEGTDIVFHYEQPDAMGEFVSTMISVLLPTVVLFFMLMFFMRRMNKGGNGIMGVGKSILGLVYEITKDPIAKAEEATAQAAYKAVFEDADSFSTYDFDAEAAASLLEQNGYSDEINGVQEALDKDGNVLGYVITVTAKDGSQGNITFSVGIKNDGTVNGYSVTSMSETPGLGDKAKTEDFSKQYKNKNVDSFTVVKQAPSADNEIEAISGATITSKAMTNGVNACITYFQNELEGGAE